MSHGPGEAGIGVPRPVAPADPAAAGRDPVQHARPGADVDRVVDDQRRAVEIAVAAEAPRARGRSSPSARSACRGRVRSVATGAEPVREEAETAGERRPARSTVSGRSARAACPGRRHSRARSQVALAAEEAAAHERRGLTAAAVAVALVGPDHGAVASAQAVDVLAREREPDAVAGDGRRADGAVVAHAAARAPELRPVGGAEARRGRSGAARTRHRPPGTGGSELK